MELKAGSRAIRNRPKASNGDVGGNKESLSKSMACVFLQCLFDLEKKIAARSTNDNNFDGSNNSNRYMLYT